MKRTALLSILVAIGAASIAAQTPAAPKVIDILKLKDNLYVLTSSIPGNAATFSGGNVAVFITDGGVTLVDDKMTIGTGKDRIDLYFFGAGHTSGDTFVVFPALRVLHTGDDFAWKDGPLCDRNNGGSCVSLPRTLQKAIAGIKNIDTVIPGHSPMQTLKDLEIWQKFTAA